MTDEQNAADAETSPLRRCGYCKTWHSRPCGESCYLQADDPTWPELLAARPQPEGADHG